MPMNRFCYLEKCLGKAKRRASDSTRLYNMLVYVI